MPLAKTYEARFLRGGGFDGGTELIVWMEGRVGPEECGVRPDASTPSAVQARFRNEAGDVT